MFFTAPAELVPDNTFTSVGAACSGNHNFLTGVVHSYSMSLLTELKILSGFVSTKISLLTELVLPLL